MESSEKFCQPCASLLEWLTTPFGHTQLLFGFIRQEVKGRFAGSVLGLFWSVLSPLSNILIYFFVFSVIFRIKMPQVETGTTSFTIYLLSGFLPWMAFAEGLGKATGCLLDNRAIISKVAFPVQVIPWSVVSVAFLLNGIGLLLFLLYLAVHGLAKGAWIMLPLQFAMLYGFTLGLAAFLAALTLFLRDLREMVGMGLQLWFYATPILYPLSMVPPRFVALVRLNPALPFIESFRQSILQGIYWSPSFTMSLLLGCLSLLAGGLCFMQLRSAFGDVV